MHHDGRIESFLLVYFVAKEATIKKIETIIRREFARELCNKEAEIELIDEVFRFGGICLIGLHDFI